ncbi:MAG: methyltransferase RsmF C-terminal domain-like protein [Candidatus Altarchaeaceae archaeon]
MIPEKLPKAKVKEINKKINERFDANVNFSLLFRKGNWIYLYTGKIIGIKAYSIGLSIGKYVNEFIPTIEGSQLIDIKKNFFNVRSDEEAWKWIRGEDITNVENINCEKGYVIVKRGEDVLGCGLYDGKIIRNRLAKSRKIKSKNKKEI